MTCGIYVIKNRITGKMYVGQSIHIEKRIKEHQHQRDINTSYIENSIAKHGWENFTWQILHECDKKDLDTEEMKFIALYNTYHNGYNLTRGGEMKGYGNPMHNPEIVKKYSESKTGCKYSKESKIRMSKRTNKTGFYRVFKEYDTKLKQGFSYRYEYRIKKGLRKVIRSINIRKLEKKVKKLGLDWWIIDEKLAEKTLIESDFYTDKAKKEHPTGYFRVSKCADKSYLKGYYYRYTHFENGKSKNIQATTISKLKEKVLSHGLEWIKLNNNDSGVVTLDDWR